MSDEAEEMISAGRKLAALWTGLVDGGVPPDQATAIVVHVTTQQKRTGPDLTALMQAATDH